MIYKSYFSAPRWSNVKKGLWGLANECGLDFKVIGHDKGWIRETIYFEVEGDDKSVEEFAECLNAAVKRHNKK